MGMKLFLERGIKGNGALLLGLGATVALPLGGYLVSGFTHRNFGNGSGKGSNTSDDFPTDGGSKDELCTLQPAEVNSLREENDNLKKIIKQLQTNHQEVQKFIYLSCLDASLMYELAYDQPPPGKCLSTTPADLDKGQCPSQGPDVPHETKCFDKFKKLVFLTLQKIKSWCFFKKKRSRRREKAARATKNDWLIKLLKSVSPPREGHRYKVCYDDSISSCF